MMKTKFIGIFAFVVLIVVMFTAIIMKSHVIMKSHERKSKIVEKNTFKSENIYGSDYGKGYWGGMNSMLIYLVKTNQIDTTETVNIDLKFFLNDLDRRRKSNKK